MNGIQLYTSNNLQVLSEDLAKVIKNSPNPFFKKNIIVVQTNGIKKWLSLELAKKNKIFTAFDFLSPESLITKYLSPIFFDDKKNVFSKRTLTWCLMKTVDKDLLNRDCFLPLKNYINNNNQVKKYQLMSILADIFDQYQVYRPQMLSKWENNENQYQSDINEDWQKGIWNLLIKNYGSEHRSNIYKSLLNHIQSLQQPLPQNFPSEISFFSLNSLPPSYFQLIRVLGTKMKIHIFYFNICKEYWGDIESDKKLIFYQKRYQKSDLSLLHLEKKNTLLANMGKTGKNLFSFIQELSFVSENEHFDHVKNNQLSLLNSIQKQILNLDEYEKKQNISSNDDSIRITSHYSKLREVEVLKDYLLDFFNNDNTLKPHDILVMTPQIAEYSPYIEAVFSISNQNKKSAELPFSIADKNIWKESRIAATFCSILELGLNRVTASEIMGILEIEAVYQKFKLTLDDVLIIRNLIIEAGINWGLDTAFRLELGTYSQDANTWEKGLEKLLTGYAILSEDDLFNFNGKKILAARMVEGNVSIVLGKFLTFYQKIYNLVRELKSEKSLEIWSQLLINILDDFFLNDSESEREIRYLRTNILELEEFQRLSHFENPVSLPIILSYVKDYISHNSFGQGFISGGITFCSMIPMRTIPFRIICLIGMNSHNFPGNTFAYNFDLVKKYQQKGDRNKRESDRYLFLETLVAAREKLYISFIGKSILDDSAKLPSTCVTELIDYICRQYTLASEKNYSENSNEENLQKKHQSGKLKTGWENITEQISKIKNHLIIEYPLHSFSPHYFSTKKTKIFTYSYHAFQASSILQNKQTKKIKHYSHAFSQKTDTPMVISLQNMLQFFKNPAKFLLKNKLNIQFPAVEQEMSDNDPLSVNNLEKYIIENKLLNQKPEYWMKNFDLLQSQGILPYDTQGKSEYKNILIEANKLHKRIASLKLSPPLPFNFISYTSRFNNKNVTICATIENLYPDVFLIYRPVKKANAFDIFSLWIHHLLLNCHPDIQIPKKSVFLCRDETIQIHPLESAQEIFNKIIQTYTNGQNRFILFTPEICQKIYKTYRQYSEMPEFFKKQVFPDIINEFRPDMDIYNKICLKNLGGLEYVSHWVNDYLVPCLTMYQDMETHIKIPKD